MRRVQPKPLYIALDFDGVLHHRNGGPSKPDFKVLESEGRRPFVQWIEGAYPVNDQKPDLLTPEGRLFDREHRLIELLKKFPKAKLVIATSWRELVGSKRLCAFLSREVRKRIAGVLDWDPSERTIDGVRGCLMEKWLIKRGQHGSVWIALDDDGRHYTKHESHLVKTHWWGLDKETVGEAADALTGRTMAPVAPL
jgi:HAD domain in Swiss Army Knife RNA repair proteins